MAPSPDLSLTGRNVLLAHVATLEATVARQQQVITTLQEQLHALEQRLGSSGGKGMPGLKPASQTRAKAGGRPRKRRAHGFARQRTPTPTRRVVHAVDHCDHCGTRVLGGWVQRHREVIDLPVAPVEVTEHVVLARQCPQCRRRLVPVVDLGRAVVGRQRLGTRLLSMIATWRETGRLPVRTIQWLLDTIYGLRLSVGAIVAASRQLARAGAAELERIRAAIRASPAVQADETGWRENGRNGYVWTFSTPTAVYFVRRGRTKEVVDEVLGETFAGILGSDFYAAYHHYPGLKQRCWAHLLREIHDLRLLYPDDAALSRWARQVQRLFHRAVAFTSTDARVRRRAQRRFEQQLLTVCRPFLAADAAVQRRLCRRVERHLSELFVFVAHPEAPPTNNGAERSLRPLVTSRKISGGTRSPQGTETKMATASLFGTWRLRGHHPLHAAHQLLAASRV